MKNAVYSTFIGVLFLVIRVYFVFLCVRKGKECLLWIMYVIPLKRDLFRVIEVTRLASE